METLGTFTMLTGWLTVVEAARCLGRTVGDDVSEAHVLRYALNQQLTLSVRFPAPVAAIKVPRKTWRRISRGDREFDLLDEPGIKIVPLEGIFDLTMKGLERYAVENAYRRLVAEPEVDIDLFPVSYCPLVASPTTSEVFGLWTIPQEMPLETYACWDWDDPHFDTQLVVRSDALEAFVSQVPPHTSERRRVAATKPLVGGPDLAAWLLAEMEKRKLSLNRLHVLTQLDRKTIGRMLTCQKVHTAGIRKLADGLSHEPPTVAIQDIPTD